MAEIVEECEGRNRNWLDGCWSCYGIEGSLCYIFVVSLLLDCRERLSNIYFFDLRFLLVFRMIFEVSFPLLLEHLYKWHLLNKNLISVLFAIYFLIWLFITF